MSKDDEDDEDDEEDEEEEERRTRQEEAEEEEEKEEEKEEKEEEEATDMKSSNPHLTGGEQVRKKTIPTRTPELCQIEIIGTRNNGRQIPK